MWQAFNRFLAGDLVGAALLYARGDMLGLPNARRNLLFTLGRLAHQHAVHLYGHVLRAAGSGAVVQPLDALEGDACRVAAGMAADSEDGALQFGDCFTHRRGGLPRDWAAARDAFARAMALGSARAAYALGYMVRCCPALAPARTRSRERAPSTRRVAAVRKTLGSRPHTTDAHWPCRRQQQNRQNGVCRRAWRWRVWLYWIGCAAARGCRH